MNYAYEPISTFAIVGMCFSGLISVTVPIVLLIYWKTKTGAKISTFFTGCATFVLFALILEQILHTIVLNSTGNAITENVWIYGLYGGLCAGVFEEVGRLLAMKFILKKRLNKENAIMYGLGHGGIEAIMICSLTMLSNIALSVTINAGGLEEILMTIPDATLRQTAYEQYTALWTTAAGMFYASGIERMLAMGLHICLSYLVYLAVSKNNMKLFFLSIGIHALVDAVTVWLNGNGCPIWVIELILAIMVAVFAYFVVKHYKTEDENVVDTSM